jgi:hypothetical protein
MATIDIWTLEHGLTRPPLCYAPDGTVGVIVTDTEGKASFMRLEWWRQCIAPWEKKEKRKEDPHE